MKTEIEKRLDKLEGYVSDELDAIRELAKENKVKEIDLFSINTYSKVCEQLKEKEESCPYKKVKQLEKLFNGNWKKNWLDRNQPKWYPWFEFYASGEFGFLASCDLFYSFSGVVGFFKDKKTSDYIGKTFIDIFKEIAES